MNKEVHIIAAEWHKYTNIDKPQTGGDKLVITDAGWITTLNYDRFHDAFCWDEENGDSIRVAYWAEIPEQLTAIQKATVDKMLRS